MQCELEMTFFFLLSFFSSSLGLRCIKCGQSNNCCRDALWRVHLLQY
jgi:hypothetical protein